ncbi:MAG: MFS transporter [Clostridiales Family XIII bacterium]|jgi:MFS family permease|nr:MFS transporter [Clostridiales Family XIII bacterium]
MGNTDKIITDVSADITGNKNGNKSSARAKIVELIMFLSYAFFAVNWIAGTTLTPQIMQHFNLESFSSATFISNAITVAKIIGNLLAAKILVKLYPKKAIIFASILIVGGSALAVLSPAYIVFIAARFVMGFGGALFIVYFGPVVFHYFDAEQRATVNGINAAAYNVGSIIAMVIVAPVIEWLVTWQNSMLFFAGCSMVLLVLWLIFGENFDLNTSGGSTETVSAPVEEYTLRQALKEKFSYAFPFTYAGLLTLYLVVLTIFPLSNNAPVDPKLLSAVVAIGGIAGSVAGIALAKKMTLRRPPIRYAGLAMTLCALAMFVTSSTAFALITAALLGFLMFLPMTSLVSIPQEMAGMTPKKLTLIMGIFWSFSYLFESIVYYLLGILIDHAGFQAGLICAVIVSLTMFIGSFLLPETGKMK